MDLSFIENPFILAFDMASKVKLYGAKQYWQLNLLFTFWIAFWAYLEHNV